MLLGVGLILVAQDTGRMLVLKELEAKPILKKEAGMLSFPLETVKKGERKNDAMERLLWEEIGITLQDVSLSPIYFGGTMEILKGIAYTASAYAMCRGEFVAFPNDTDISFYGWMKPIDLLETRNIRVETGPILRIFLGKKRFGLL